MKYKQTRVIKSQSGTVLPDRTIYQQITADGPQEYTDGYGTKRQRYESPIIATLRKTYHWINGDRTLSNEAYLKKHGFNKPVGEIGTLGLLIPTETKMLQELAKKQAFIDMKKSGMPIYKSEEVLLPKTNVSIPIKNNTTMGRLNNWELSNEPNYGRLGQFSTDLSVIKDPEEAVVRKIGKSIYEVPSTKQVGLTPATATNASWDKFLAKTPQEQDDIVRYWNGEKYSNFNILKYNRKGLASFKRWWGNLK